MVPLTQPENEDREQGRRLLPLLLDLNSKLVVIFGGGRVGERKAKLFSDYARVRVVAQDFALDSRRWKRTWSWWPLTFIRALRGILTVLSW